MQRCRAQERYSDLTWDNFRIRFFDILGMLYPTLILILTIISDFT